MDFPKERGSPLRKLWKTVQACKENKTFNADVKKTKTKKNQNIKICKTVLECINMCIFKNI